MVVDLEQGEGSSEKEREREVRALVTGLLTAFVAAWLLGTEGQGVADVLFGDYGPLWCSSGDSSSLCYALFTSCADTVHQSRFSLSSFPLSQNRSEGEKLVFFSSGSGYSVAAV